LTRKRTGRKPLALDLCCGSGGWTAGLEAAGFEVIGIDLADFGQQIRADVRNVDGRQWRDCTALVVASPPCPEFSRWDMPWTRRRNPPPPDLSIVGACYRIAWEARAPIVLENVRGAQIFLGRARAHTGPYYLWGDVPTPLPKLKRRHKQTMSSTWVIQRSRVPFALAYCIGAHFNPEIQLRAAA
jgi:hypothetical protein